MQIFLDWEKDAKDCRVGEIEESKGSEVFPDRVSEQGSGPVNQREYPSRGTNPDILRNILSRRKLEKRRCWSYCPGRV